MRAPTLLLIFFIYSTGCNSGDLRNEQTHPQFDEEYFIGLENLVENELNSAGIEEIKVKFQNAKLLGKIDSALVLGTIADIEFDDANNLYLLDQSQIKILKMDKDGSIDSLGRKGSGPGEMLFPSSMEIINDQNIVVGDIQRGLVHISQNADERIEDDLHFVSGTSYSDIKRSGRGFYLRKSMIIEPNARGEIYTIDFYDAEEDAITYSFGNAYKSGNRLAVRSYSSGLIEYVSENNMVISSNIHSPIISAYVDGALVWERKVNGFIPFRMVSTDNPEQISYHKDFTQKENEFDELVTLLSLVDDLVLVQIQRGQRSRNIEDKVITSYILDTNIGKALKFDSLPRILAVTTDRFVTLEETGNSKYKLYSF
jgi:uncharacterized protein YpiB (UPF0302 family)